MNSLVLVRILSSLSSPCLNSSVSHGGDVLLDVKVLDILQGPRAPKADWLPCDGRLAASARPRRARKLKHEPLRLVRTGQAASKTKAEARLVVGLCSLQSGAL